MAENDKYLKHLATPRLSPVRTEPGQPVVTMRIPSGATVNFAYEPFEYTSLGFTDAHRGPDGVISVSRNFRSYVECVMSFRELVGIVEGVRSNVLSLFGERAGEASYKDPWEMVLDVSPELDLCIQQKIAETLPHGVLYAGGKLAFRAQSFEQLSDLMKGFFQGGLEPDSEK